MSEMARPLIRGALLAAGLAWCVGCSSGTTAGPTNPPDPSLRTITIDATGVASPKTLTVPLGSQVTFINNDRVVHEMFSNPHPEHTDCPEFDAVGRLAPGESRQTTNLVTTRTCGFHDHLNPLTAGLNGSVRIQ